jgi:hypothetical protein
MALKLGRGGIMERKELIDINLEEYLQRGSKDDIKRAIS